MPMKKSWSKLQPQLKNVEIQVVGSSDKGGTLVPRNMGFLPTSYIPNCSNHLFCLILFTCLRQGRFRFRSLWSTAPLTRCCLPLRTLPELQITLRRRTLPASNAPGRAGDGCSSTKDSDIRVTSE